MAGVEGAFEIAGIVAAADDLERVADTCVISDAMLRSYVQMISRRLAADLVAAAKHWEGGPIEVLAVAAQLAQIELVEALTLPVLAASKPTVRALTDVVEDLARIAAW